MMRQAVLGLAIGLLPLAARAQFTPGPAIPTIVIHLDNFAFAPDRIQLRDGARVRLHLANDSNGSHNFSASELFATSTFPAGGAPSQGTIEVAGHGSADLELTPHTPGTYQFDCTHFLHHMFGMHGTIVVLPQ
jgi:plastocyanin